MEEAVLLRLPKQASISDIASRVMIKGAIEIMVVAKNNFADYYLKQHKIYWFL